LERWPVRMLRELMPRPTEIIEEINARFLAEVARRWPGDIARQRRMSIIEEGPEPMVRMAYLAIVGSFSINGVAALHSELLTRGLFRDFHALWPQRFNNKTNGVTPRRWLEACNPGLTALLDGAIGKGWRHDLDELSRLRPLAEDADFRARWHAVKQHNKIALAAAVARHCHVHFEPEWLFDVQVKRIHEYKRQLLNVLHMIYLYCRIKHGSAPHGAPRCVLLAGKAAPGYSMAKLIVKLINNVARVINDDDEMSETLKVAFLPDFRVSSMEIICPAADLSEQISTAGKEASGTGNMKLMMNGAVTIGTHDGANIEILDAVGSHSFYEFGLDADEVEAMRANYCPREIVLEDEALSEVMNLLTSGHFNQFEPSVFRPVIDSILSPKDPWMIAADFRSYVEAQARAAADYLDRDRWVRMSIFNAAASGRFSSDRTIREYNERIWRLDRIELKPRAA
ncbi:MAG: glycogen/starch/alpha-glucan family phosphorylase, partial [Gammaproteobacteria bacterium]